MSRIGPMAKFSVFLKQSYKQYIIIIINPNNYTSVEFGSWQITIYLKKKYYFHFLETVSNLNHNTVSSLSYLWNYMSNFCSWQKVSKASVKYASIFCCPDYLWRILIVSKIRLWIFVFKKIGEFGNIYYS